MNRQQPDTPDAFADEPKTCRHCGKLLGDSNNPPPFGVQYCDRGGCKEGAIWFIKKFSEGMRQPEEPPVCTIDDRLLYRLQWLVYGGIGVLVAGVGLAIYRMMR